MRATYTKRYPGKKAEPFAWKLRGLSLDRRTMVTLGKYHADRLEEAERDKVEAKRQGYRKVVIEKMDAPREAEGSGSTTEAGRAVSSL